MTDCSEKADIVIIGAGVVGLAAAARLARPDRCVVILERNEKHGMETSSRNSEVIHSGIYYPRGTMKARFCVEGNRMLYEYCAEHGIRHKKTGKIVVASSEEENHALVQLKENGGRNGVSGLKLLSRIEMQSLEPEIDGYAGLLVPSTGIIDTHGLMSSFLKTAQENGAMLVCRANVTGICSERNRSAHHNNMHVQVNGGEYSISARYVINCAGLYSDRIAEMAGIDVDAAGYRIHYCKGQYFRIHRKLNVQRLIYPVPHKNIQSLGVHLVLDLDGNVRFGPDAVYVDRIDYAVDESARPVFVSAIRRYLRSIREDELQPDTAGIRPKLQPEGGEFRDFVIERGEGDGLHGLINLIGIDSPGLTSSMAIARHVELLVGYALGQ